MKVEQLIGILGAQAKMLDVAGAADPATVLRSLAASLEPAKSAQVKAVCAKIASASVTESVDGPLVASVLDHLGLLRDLLESASAKSASDIALLIDVLTPLAGRSISLIGTALTPKSKTSRTGAKTRATAELDIGAIRQLADRLMSANGDDQKFKSILGELKAQKLSKPEVFAIANRFLGVEPSRKYDSIKLAFQRIEERHFQDAISASRERSINQINH